jgi:hypothetical protein
MRTKITGGLAAVAVAAALAPATPAQAASPEGFATVERTVVAGGPLDPSKPTFLTLQQGRLHGREPRPAGGRHAREHGLRDRHFAEAGFTVSPS